MLNNKDYSNTALVFPGISVKMSGYERDLYNRYKSIYKPFFMEGSEKTGIELKDIVLKDNFGDLDEWKQQVFIYCYSAGTFQILLENKIYPKISAGYSFGIYSAICASKAFSFKDGMLIIQKAFSLISELSMSLERNIQMSVVIGLSIDTIDSIIQENTFETVCHINSNNEICHILLGDRYEMSNFNKYAIKAEAINVVLLDVTRPYHNPRFLKKSFSILRPFLDTINWQEPTFPILSTINQELLETIEDLKTFIANHLCSPISWHKTAEYICAHNFDPIIECGPGISLTQNARFIANKAKWVNVKNCKKRLGI